MYPFEVFLVSGLLTSFRYVPKSKSVVCLNPFQLNYTHLMTNLFNVHKMTSKCELANDLNDWNFSPSKLLQFPFDPIRENFVRRNVKNSLFSHVKPTPLSEPKLVAYSEDALQNILNMDIKITQSNEFAEFIAGNKVLESSTPMAHRYGGHQFGYWAMQLGDGRAILLGEYVNW